MVRPATTIASPVALLALQCSMQSSTDDALLEGRRLIGLSVVQLRTRVLRGSLRTGLTPRPTRLSLLVVAILFHIGLALPAHHGLAPLDEVGMVDDLPIGLEVELLDLPIPLAAHN